MTLLVRGKRWGSLGITFQHIKAIFTTTDVTTRSINLILVVEPTSSFSPGSLVVSRRASPVVAATFSIRKSEKKQQARKHIFSNQTHQAMAQQIKLETTKPNHKVKRRKIQPYYNPPHTFQGQVLCVAYCRMIINVK